MASIPATLSSYAHGDLCQGTEDYSSQSQGCTCLGGAVLKNKALQAAKREHVQLLSKQAAINSTARDTTKQIAAVKAETAKLERKIEDVQQRIAVTEVTPLSHRHALLFSSQKADTVTFVDLYLQQSTEVAGMLQPIQIPCISS